MIRPPLRVAVIGLGNMGKHHARIYHELPGVHLVAVCDIHETIGLELATRYGCQFYSSVDSLLLAESLDAVSITVPTALHYSVAKKVLSGGIHALIEKPIADTLDHADDLIQLAAAKSLVLTVGHIERFNPAVRCLKAKIDEGVLGDVVTLNAKRVGAFPNQIKDATVAIDLAVHDIDIFAYLLNRAPSRVTGHSHHALIEDRHDFANILVEFGDKSGIIQVNWITPIRIRTLSVTGTKGHAEIDYLRQTLTLIESVYTKTTDANGQANIVFSPQEPMTIPLPTEEPLHEELTHFLACIRTDSQPIVTGKMAREALAAALDIGRL